MVRRALGIALMALLCGATRTAWSAAFANTWGVVLSSAPAATGARCIWTLSDGAGVSLSGSCADGSTMSAMGVAFPDPDSFQLEGLTPNVVFVSGSASADGTRISGVLGLPGGLELSFSGTLCGNDVLDGGEQCDAA